MVQQLFLHKIIAITPEPQRRPRAAIDRVNDRAMVHDDPKNKSYRQILQIYLTQAMGGRSRSILPLEVTIHFHVPIPRSWAKKEKAKAARGLLLPSSRPDLDNYVKAVFDAMNGIVFKDDAQVVSLRTLKLYSERPLIEIEVKEFIID